jgi:hypothetical protein
MSNVKSGLEALQLVSAQIESLGMEKKAIDARIAELRGKEEEIRASIFAEMVASQEKVLNIGGLAEVCVRKSPKQFVIKDESAFSDLARRSGRYEDIFKTEVKMSKVAANKFIGELQSCGSLPGFVEVQSGDDSLSITWEKAKPVAPVRQVRNPVAVSDSDLLGDMDTL